MTLSIIAYGQQGGHIFIEGAEALGNVQAGSGLFWFIFGLDDVESGTTNSLDFLQGQEGTIMAGLEFNSSNQIDVNNIDIYEPNPDMSTSEIAFVESDYGAVAVQFDGADFFGQKTFCISYSLANLEDGEYPNTRDELLFRILNFFDVTTGTNEEVYATNNNIQLYPNPASSDITLAFNLNEESTIKVELYNLTGQKVLIEPERYYSAGKHKIHMDTDQLMAGTYFYNVITSNQTFSGKLVIVK
jgi:hypothetical protein